MKAQPRLHSVTWFVILVPFAISVAPKDPARVSATRAKIEGIQMALERCWADIGQYPTETQGLQTLVKDPGIEGWNGPYIIGESPLKDPWGLDFRYRLIDGKPSIDSAGPDMVFGTEDDRSRDSPLPSEGGCSASCARGY